MCNERPTQSNPALVPSTGNLEQILHEQKFFYRIMKNRKSTEHVINDKHEPIHALNQDFQSLNRDDPPLFQASRAQLGPAALNSETASDMQIC